jgi:hypothetical protein
MASGTADLQRDLGGALMTSIFGALLTAGYASAMGKAIDAAGADVAADTQAQLQLSFASAESLAQRYPQYAEQITAAARSSFLDGDRWAYAAAMLAVLIGMTLVFRFFPGKEGEERLRASYQPAPCGTGVLGTGPRTRGRSVSPVLDDAPAASLVLNGGQVIPKRRTRERVDDRRGETDG